MWCGPQHSSPKCGNELLFTQESALEPSMKNTPRPIWGSQDGSIGKSTASSWKKFKVLAKIQMKILHVHLNLYLFMVLNILFWS